MPDALWITAAGLLSTLGMACLALSQERHRDTLGLDRHRPPTHAIVRRWRLQGTALLALTLGLCVWQDGAAFGSLLWLMLLSAGAFAVALQLSFGPNTLRWLLCRHDNKPPAPARTSAGTG